MAVRTVQDILYAIAGQTLFFDAPEGRPSSVTSITVFRSSMPDDGQAELATTGSAAVETNPATTTDAAAGFSQTDLRHIPLTATTGVAIGRDYLLTNAAGLKEWVEVAAITAADSIDARNPLHNDYASGATFVSTRISIALLDSWVADRNRIGGGITGSGPYDGRLNPDPHYRVRWVYVVAGVSYIADTYFNLVRYAGRHGVVPEDIDNMVPGWINGLPADHRADQGRRFIDEAYRGVKLDLAAAEVDDSGIAESEVLDELVRHKAVEMAEWSKFLQAGRDETRHLAAAKKYASRLESFVTLASRVLERSIGGGATHKMAIGLTRLR